MDACNPVQSRLVDLTRTVLVAEAAAAGAATGLTITVPRGGREPEGRARALAALTATFQELQRRGVPVSVTPWERVKG